MWTAVLLGSAACYALKLAGLSVPRRILEDRRMQRVAAVLPVALLGALAATQTFAEGRHLAIDARAAGVAAALVAIWRRAPFIAVVGIAAATSALTRLAT
jgi:branched-subunit amino acid transport protein